DLNSLYATALTDKYPVSNYEWATEDKLNRIDWKTYAGDKGFILKVDLGYTEELQDETVDLPLAPERCIIQATELSVEPQQDMQNLKTGNTFISKPRLQLHCGERKDYVVHYNALKYYLEVGMVLKKVVSGFENWQRPSPQGRWLSCFRIQYLERAFKVTRTNQLSNSAHHLCRL
ncbi:unnamed protein product, partial [Allacma fusca]